MQRPHLVLQSKHSNQRIIKLFHEILPFHIYHPIIFQFLLIYQFYVIFDCLSLGIDI